jgi:hypothetical protein
VCLCLCLCLCVCVCVCVHTTGRWWGKVVYIELGGGTVPFSCLFVCVHIKGSRGVHWARSGQKQQQRLQKQKKVAAAGKKRNGSGRGMGSFQLAVDTESNLYV